MHWLTIAYSVTAAACVTLALVHLLVWVRQPSARAHLAFFVTAISVAAVTPFEWLMVRAQTIGQFGSAQRWVQVPIAFGIVSLVWFLWLYLRTGRRWLALAVCTLRVLAMILSFFFTPNLNYRKITELRQVPLFLGESASAPIGVINPWTAIGQLSTLLLLVYVVDASIKLWRQGDRDSHRRALLLGGATAFFVIAAAGNSTLIITGLIVSPFLLSFPFLAIVLAMGYELSSDVVKAGQLSLEVKANEERLLLAQEASRIGTFDYDFPTGRLSWTEQLESIYGLVPGSFGGTSECWQVRVHPEDLPRCEAEVSEAIRQRRSSWESESRISRADSGEMRWINGRARFFFDAHGEPVRMLGVNVDITPRKLAEEAAHKGEERNRDLLRAIPDLVFLQTPEGVYLDYHAPEPRDLFVPPAEFLGKNMTDVLPPELAKDFVNCFKRATETGEPQVMEYKLPIQDQERRFETRIVRTARNEILSVVRDITGRMQAEEALRASESRFRNMADTAPVLIWIAGTDKLCTYFNQGWLNFTGRTMEQELGNGWAEGVYADDFTRCLDVYNRAFDRREPFKMEYRLRRADGEYRWIYDCGTPRFSAEGEFLGYIGSCIDIGDQKIAEEDLRKALEEVRELKNQLQAENIILQEEIKLAHKVNEIVGESNALKYVLFKVEQVAQTNSSVLILGETGTGKELVARAIHDQSKRKDRPLIKVNCAALSPTLIESELFGHEKGAFTDARARKIGRFELANGATLFLDEIGELPLELQSKLLRVIEEGEFERLGSSQTIKVDVRIIAATNRNMKAAVEKGRFREDLWYRLNVFPITVPPLRQRKEDIPALVEHFVKGMSVSFGRPITSISSATLKKLQDYSWPGNVRELANVIERAVINAQGPVLHIVDHFEQPTTSDLPELSKTIEEVEREYIIRILDATSWRIGGPNGAAKILGLNPSTLRTRMVKLGIQKNISASAGG